MSDIDKEFIQSKLENLRDYLQKLEEFQAMEKSKFLADHHHYGLAEHYMQQAIEIILDICRHFVIALELKTPDDPHGLFALLESRGVLASGYAEANAKMVGFRNRLVHEYSEIDHEKTYSYLHEHLKDLNDFLRQVSVYINSGEN
jgi:uncharacterized protein YutE (UPF0331/DUF86 family)